MKTVGFVIPTLNEAERIASVLESIPSVELASRGYEAIPLVVDGNSVDGTTEIAQRLGAVVVRQSGRGKGQALREVFSNFQFDYGIVLDGDGTYPAQYAASMLDPLSDGVDVVLMARRRPDGTRKRDRLNQIGNRLLTGSANLLLGTDLRDLCTGMWGFKSSVLRVIQLEADGFDVEAEMFSRAVKSGFVLRQLEVPYEPREEGSKLRPFRDGLQILRRIVREAFRFQLKA